MLEYGQGMLGDATNGQCPRPHYPLVGVPLDLDDGLVGFQAPLLLEIRPGRHPGRVGRPRAGNVDEGTARSSHPRASLGRTPASLGGTPSLASPLTGRLMPAKRKLLLLLGLAGLGLAAGYAGWDYATTGVTPLAFDRLREG